jgi:hypothetical protein
MTDRILDEKGFVREGEHIIIPIPAYNAVLPFRVRSIANKGTEFFNYGPVPYTFSGYPEGVITARSTTPGFKWKDRTGRLVAEQAADMFYFTVPNKLIHAYIDIRPHLFRIYREIPTGTKQTRYLDAVTFTTEVDETASIFGYTVGVVEHIFLPNFHVDWFVHNATNMDLRTSVMIKYAEYEVELVKDPALIFSMLMRQVPAYWWTLPAVTRFNEMDRLLSEIYKITPIPHYRQGEKEKALREIPDLIKGATI